MINNFINFFKSFISKKKIRTIQIMLIYLIIIDYIKFNIIFIL